MGRTDSGGFDETGKPRVGASRPTRTTVAVHQLPDPQLAIERKAITSVG